MRYRELVAKLRNTSFPGGYNCTFPHVGRVTLNFGIKEGPRIYLDREISVQIDPDELEIVRDLIEKAIARRDAYRRGEKPHEANSTLSAMAAALRERRDNEKHDGEQQ